MSRLTGPWKKERNFLAAYGTEGRRFFSFLRAVAFEGVYKRYWKQLNARLTEEIQHLAAIIRAKSISDSEEGEEERVDDTYEETENSVKASSRVYEAFRRLMHTAMKMMDSFYLRICQMVHSGLQVTLAEAQQLVWI